MNKPEQVFRGIEVEKIFWRKLMMYRPLLACVFMKKIKREGVTIAWELEGFTAISILADMFSIMKLDVLWYRIWV